MYSSFLNITNNLIPLDARLHMHKIFHLNICRLIYILCIMQIICFHVYACNFGYQLDADNFQIYISIPDIVPKFQTHISSSPLTSPLSCLTDTQTQQVQNETHDLPSRAYASSHAPYLRKRQPPSDQVFKPETWKPSATPTLSLPTRSIYPKS